MVITNTMYHLLFAMSLFSAGQSAKIAQIAPGPFEPTDASLARNYRYPDWFRDAKLGIWAHWGPQSVPMEGDWYARNMYIEGSGQYKHHLATYGPPSQKGYKDIIPLWRAEKWDPDRLMGLYRLAGARYFVSMACHHDNFDLWDSKFHSWNAVNMGPKRDVVGTWQKAAKRLGMKFGVSEHLGASFTWFQPSHGADKAGPYAGVPYDGANQAYEELYHRPAAASDHDWLTKDPVNQAEWYRRIRDLVDSYQPDLLYSDSGMPFGNDVGRSLIAHLYNTNAARNGGHTQAVYTCKQASDGRWVEDLERGVMAGIRPHPWQSDTSIGDWFYNKHWKYRGADWVIRSLVDIVSKNGNLLINVVQRPDGSLDPEAEQVLAELAQWTHINGEGIFSTRPWLTFGEGQVRAHGGSFLEDFAYTSHDIRFTTKGRRTLYAFSLGLPADSQLHIRSLARTPESRAVISSVKLLGFSGNVSWTRTAEGLDVILPKSLPSKYVLGLKISCNDVNRFAPELGRPVTHENADGNLSLKAEDADLHGDLRTELRDGTLNIGFWDHATDSATWNVVVRTPGRYRVVVNAATTQPLSQFDVGIDGSRTSSRIESTGGWDKFADVEAGIVQIKHAGAATLTIRPHDAATWGAINLRSIWLVRVRQ